MSSRYTLKFAGESGQGINTLGKLISDALKDTGYYIFAYREYPSLIKGGYASYQIDYSLDPISSSYTHTNILIALDNDSTHEYLKSIQKGGILVYDSTDIVFTPEEESFISQNQIQKIFLNTKQITQEITVPILMSNIILLSFIWKILGQDIETLKETVSKTFQKKGDEIVSMNIKCVETGYTKANTSIQTIGKPQTNGLENKALTGNDAIALGAIAAGVRAYYAYPMTPATSIFKYLGNTYKQTGILIKQAENEITAAQMTLGSMAMGTRALTATSGGGFDLMIETISCAGMSETPLVIILAQRIGAGTGVPTWTGAGDLNTALKGGHGDFPRAVLSVSDVKSCYTQIQNALNIAEIYQIPVILLTEKQIAESIFTIDELPQITPISRGLGNGEHRYQITENGISPRWIPDTNSPIYIQTTDEHNEDGYSTERQEEIIQMSDKRMKKMQTLKSNLPEPEYFGDANAQTVLVGMGSVKNPIIDAMKENNTFGYLHFEYMYPLKTEKLSGMISSGKRLIIVENNQGGSFANLIKQESGIDIKEKVLKYDGKPFFVQDILNIVNK